MKKVPYWKVKRELTRLIRKLVEIPELADEYFHLRSGHYKRTNGMLRVHSGNLPLGDEAAIYLIFPSDGLLPSHLSVLRLINAEGISPVVVSNLPLTDADLSTLSPLSTKIIERPNLGYDFGGYRDGVLELANDLPGLRRLYILNDSVWMVEAPTTWFADVRSRDVDFCGATSNYGIKRYDADDFRELRWQYTQNHRNFHYASYALAMGSRILRDPAFVDFWRRFRMSNNKKRTVRRGEIGLTQWAMRHGYSHDATCPVTNLDAEIAGLDAAELDELTRHLIIPERPRVRAVRDEVLASDPQSDQGRSDRIQIILTAVSAQAMGYVMPYYTLRHRGFQFVKKSPLWISRKGSETTLDILSGLRGAMGQEACEEAKVLARRLKEGFEL
ncbi:Rhamnan synthesis protein F [Roseovarius azorensis]|uniref:Rhamnan synthesis protein F n=1 Tax=Roseovarius azorensis TaxID=1287727 RepID=A0A1H7QJ02_9RHOB|nr:rhamnan synthesis F family protein [Roseovarius azorensis]SEL47594.1 Rhamnan synthesis protein F [Roseovarius azorensis]